VIQNLSGKAQQGIQIKYPNYSHAPAGTVANFWNYDDQKGWQVYGKGHVSADGTQFVPDPGVALTTTIHGSFTLLDPKLGSSDLYRRAVERLQQFIPGTFTDDDPAPERVIPFAVHIDELRGRCARPGGES